jgi:predicted phosphodiesterase
MGKKLLVIGDMHAGSNVSLAPPSITMEDGDREYEIKSNRISKRLYSWWEEMCDDVGKVDMVIANGDLCEGTNPHSRGGGLWTSEIMVQVNTAIELLEMIKAKEYIGTQGSFYHVSDNLSSDAVVLAALNGTFDDEIKITVDKVRFHFMHKVGISRSAWFYRPTPIAREMMLGELNKLEYGKIHIYGRAHAHYFVAVEYGNSYGFIAPCWKGRDAYAKRGTLAWMPHIGYILFEVNGSEWQRYKHTWSLKGKQLIKEVKI